MKLYNLIFTLIITSSSAYATGVTIPNSFSSGTTTSAAEMNANFDAVKAAVDDNDSRITTLEGSVSAPASQFMGFSSGTTDGAGGSITMGNLCHTSFAGSHMCSTVEFIGAKMNGVSVSGSAWVLPVLQAGPTVNNGMSFLELGTGITDTNKPSASLRFSCAAWSSNSSGDFGLSTGASGSITRGNCSEVHSVACCK